MSDGDTAIAWSRSQRISTPSLLSFTLDLALTPLVLRFGLCSEQVTTATTLVTETSEILKRDFD